MSKYFYLLYHSDGESIPRLVHSSDIKEKIIKEGGYRNIVKKLVRECYPNNERFYKNRFETLKRISKMTIRELVDSIDAGEEDFCFYYSDIVILERRNYQAYKKLLEVWKNRGSFNNVEILTDFIIHWAVEDFMIPSSKVIESISLIDKAKEESDLIIYLLDSEEVVRNYAERRRLEFSIHSSNDTSHS